MVSITLRGSSIFVMKWDEANSANDKVTLCFFSLWISLGTLSIPLKQILNLFCMDYIFEVFK